MALTAGLILIASGVAAIVGGAMWNFAYFQKSGRPARPALRTQAVGIG
jgi:hypothetical protein